MSETFFLDGEPTPFEPGQTVMQASLAAGKYIPHLCYHPEFRPHGSCKVCTVKVNGIVETQPGRKLFAGDHFQVENGDEWAVSGEGEPS